MSKTIYYRMKATKDTEGRWQPDANGSWNYVPVPDGVGKPPQWVLDAEKNGGSFYLRPGGEKYPSRKAAREAAAKAEVAATAVQHGLAIEESDPNRTSLRAAVERYLERKAKKSAKTVQQYTFILEEFLAWKSATVRFVDQINEDVLLKYQRWLEDDKKQHPKTVTNKLLTVCFMLKQAGVENPSRLIEWPTIEEEPAEPYAAEDLSKLFAYLQEKNHEDALAFEFFLATACREKEVAHATWRDFDWNAGEYRVCAKNWDTADGVAKQFTPKKHESRVVPLTDELVVALKARKAKSNSPWVFPNQQGEPEGHFLRSWKRVARAAGLNCGGCTCVKNGETVKHACADSQGECHEHYLHRLRKSRATYWHQELHIDLRTIQAWLGHKSLETTQKYLGVQSTKKLQPQLNKPMYKVA